VRTWKTLKQEPVLDSPWMKVFKETVVTASGRVVDDFYTAVRRDVAMVAARTADGRVVLIKEYKHASGEFVWQLPAGAIDDGELPLDTAARELEEETGMRAR
jgi:ADP-ribose pyrophosphatase